MTVKQRHFLWKLMMLNDGHTGQKNAAAEAAAVFKNAGLELDPNAQLKLSG
jgi:hypothetical protein